MNQLSIFRVWRALVICAFAALFTMVSSGVAVAECRDSSRSNDEAVRGYRATVRDVRQGCTGDSSAVCEAAEQAAEDAFSALAIAHETLLNDCDVPPAAPSPTSPGQLVITEMMIDPDSVADTVGEWFEVYNPTASNWELQGLTIALGVSSFTIDSSLIIPPDGYVVFGRNGDPNLNGGVLVDYVNSGVILPNNDGVIEIKNGATTIDRVEYVSGTWPIEAGRSTSLDPSEFDAIRNDNYFTWCAAPPSSQLPGGDYGTPGAINDDCFTGCVDDSFEDNDDYLQATFLGTSAVFQGLTSASGDSDWFYFQLLEGEQINIEVYFAHADGNIDIYLYDSNLTQVASSESETDNENIVYTGEAPPPDDRTHYLEVRMLSVDSCGEYDLVINLN